MQHLDDFLWIVCWSTRRRCEYCLSFPSLAAHCLNLYTAVQSIIKSDGCNRSGQLNAKHRELVELTTKTRARITESKSRIAEGLRDSRQVRDDLDWTHKRTE